MANNTLASGFAMRDNQVEQELLTFEKGVAAMKNLALAVCLLTASQGLNAQAATGFHWFRTRPKPILVDEQSASATAAVKAPKRVAYQAAEPKSSSSRVEAQSSKSRMSDFVRGLRTRAPQSKPESKK